MSHGCVTHRRDAQRRKCKACLRNCVRRYGQRSGAQLEAGSPAPAAPGRKRSLPYAWVVWSSPGHCGDRSHADELRDACMSVALELGGWDKPADLHGRTACKRRDKQLDLRYCKRRHLVCRSVHAWMPMTRNRTLCLRWNAVSNSQCYPEQKYKDGFLALENVHPVVE